MFAQERILLVRLSHLGDVVHALPVFHALRRSRPQARIAWAVQAEWAPLVDGLAGLERTLHFDRRGGPRSWLELHSELACFAPTLAVDAQGNLKSALVTLSSGAPRRVGLHPRDWREPAGALVLTERAPAAGGSESVVHAVARMQALARHVAGLGPGEPLRADPALSPEETAHGAEELARRCGGLDDTQPPLAIVQLARAGDVRSWPAGHFAKLALDLLARDQRVLLLSGPEEEPLGRELEQRLPASERLCHWVGQRGLRELAGVFTAAARAKARLIGCDSGPLHLAAACGLPVIALCGPQDPRRTGPWPLPDSLAGQPVGSLPSPHRVVQARSSPPCAPCRSRVCTHPLGPVCMRELEPELVLQALLAP